MPGLAAQLRELDSGTSVTLLRVCNVVCGLLGFAIAGCWHVYRIVGCSDEDVDGQPVDDGDCMSFFPSLSSAVVALYIMCVLRARAQPASAPTSSVTLCAPFGTSRLTPVMCDASPLSAILVMFEMSRGKTDGRVRTWLERNTGFIFLYNRRYQFLILCVPSAAKPSPAPHHSWARLASLRGDMMLGRSSLGMLICGNASDNNSPEWTTMVVGVLLLVNAVLHIIVRQQNPEWDAKMIEQLEAAAARRAAGGADGGAPSTGFGQRGGAVPPPMPSTQEQAHAPRSFDSIAPSRRANTPPRYIGGTPPASGATAI